MEKGTRKIIHVDMDAFYASVEQRDKPELRGKPVVVGGRPSSRGVVAACSYEARKFGIHSAMSSAQALRLCPGAVFVPPDFARYKEASRLIRGIFLSVTDLVEPLSLDEAYLDVTENKLGEPLASRIAVHIRKQIFEQLGLTASAGVAPNKFLAKLASDMKKPNGLVVISPDRVRETVERLPVGKLWGVGPSTERKLFALGFKTTEDLRRSSAVILERFLGRFGPFLFGLAHGEDPRLVNANRTPKSRGAETTFEKDIVDIELLRSTIEELAEDVARSLHKATRRAQTVTLKLRYKDFTTITRSRTLARAFDSAAEISQEAYALLINGTEAGKKPVRLVGVSVSGLIGEDEPEQMEFVLR